MDYQWYPGHMTKAKRMMEENIKLIDLVIEIIDARIPFSSRNPDIDSLAKNKSRIILLNKSDLADDSANQAWIDYYKSKGFYCLKINAKNGYGIKQVTPLINEACSEKIARDRAKGIQNRPIRAMIVGIPNVGKSTFINAFAGKACTKTGNKPGVTKGKQWIHINKNLELLDTPGILWPKFDDKLVGMRLAMIGSMNDQVINLEDLSFEILKFIKENYPGFINARYELDENREILEIMDEIGRIRGCLKKGSMIDYEKLAGVIADDFRSGRLGRITLERP
jgi:ribosome biogenesis GTPase A